MKKIFRKEVIIGFWVVVACVILFFGINYLKGINIFKAANYYYATYDEVQGLETSAPVMLNGYKVGLVREIKYDYAHPGNVSVEMSLDKSLKIPVGSQATISSDFLGTASVVLKLSNPEHGYYAVGDTLIGTNQAGLMDALSDGLMPALSSIMPKIDTLMVGLNNIVANPSLKAALDRFDDITFQLNSSMTQLRGLLAQLGPVAADVKSITSNVDTITGDLTNVSASLREIPIDSIVAELQATLTNIHALTEQLNNPDSSVGKLLNDPALYDNMNATVNSLDSLFVDIKKNPKRYINIKVF